MYRYTINLRKIHYALIIAGFLILCQYAFANPATQSLGVNGYDLVAFHTQDKAVKGDSNNWSFYNDTTYLFSTAENKKMFDANPSKYLPQYGGYCALGVTMGFKLPVDPTAYKLVNDKLYFNLNKKSQDEWMKDLEKNIKEADLKWQTIKDKDPSKL